MLAGIWGSANRVYAAFLPCQFHYCDVHILFDSFLLNSATSCLMLGSGKI
jgi:hypothetical protein